MTSIGSRLDRLERHRIPSMSPDQERAFWEARLPNLSDHQLDRLEAIIIQMNDLQQRPAGEVRTWVEAMSVLPEAERAEMLAIFASMGMEPEDLDL